MIGRNRIIRRANGHREQPGSDVQSSADVSVANRLRLVDEMPQGDCFVVVNCRGECWDGSQWIALWTNAVHFRRPEPAYELCEAAAREAKELTGEAGMVCYLPPGTPASFVLAPVPDLSQVDLRDFARKPEVC